MKNDFSHTILFAAIFSLYLVSCYSPRYMYSPAATNVPILTKKGDSKLAAYYSNSTFGGRDIKKINSFGFDAQAAYAVNKHWLLMINQSYRYEKTSDDFETYVPDSSFIRYKRSLTEIGGGYFTAMNDSSKLFVQFTGGIGFGKFGFDDNGRDAVGGYYSRFHRSNVTKLFFQPALQLRFSKSFTSSFASRFVVLWYHSIKTNYTEAEQNSYLLNGLTASPRTFWEPAIINNFSFNKLPALEFELQFGFAALISRRFIDYRAVNISAGLIINIAKLKKQIK